MGRNYRGAPLSEFGAEIARFHATISRSADLSANEAQWRGITPEQLLQGPLAGALTQAGQLAMRWRLTGHPLPP